ARAIADFVAHGGAVIADGEPGLFDEHGRRQTTPLLSKVFVGPATRATSSFAFGKGTASYLAAPDERHRDRIRNISTILDRVGVKPAFPLKRADGMSADDVETHIFHNGEVTILAVQRDFAERPAAPGQ